MENNNKWIEKERREQTKERKRRKEGREEKKKKEKKQESGQCVLRTTKSDWFEVVLCQQFQASAVAASQLFRIHTNCETQREKNEGGREEC